MIDWPANTIVGSKGSLLFFYLDEPIRWMSKLELAASHVHSRVCFACVKSCRYILSTLTGVRGQYLAKISFFDVQIGT